MLIKEWFGFSGKGLMILSLFLISITLSCCIKKPQKNPDKEYKKKQLTILMDSIDNEDVFRIPHLLLNQTIKALSLTTVLKDSVSMCQLTIIKANCFYVLQYPDSTITALQQAIKIAKMLQNDTLLAKANNSLGAFHTNLGDYPKATNAYTKAMHLMEKAGNKKGIASIKNNLGIIYKEIGEFEKSIKYYKEALYIADSLNDKEKIARLYLNLTSVYSSLVDSVNTLKYFDKSYSIFQKLGDTLHMIKLLINKSTLYIAMNKDDSAKYSLNLVIEYSKKIDNNMLYCVALYNMGVLYFKNIKDYTKAKKYLEECLKTVQKLPDVVSIMNAMGILAEIEKMSGNYKKSDSFFRKYIALKDSILGGHVKKEVMAIEMENNLEKQEYETRFLKQKIEIQFKQKTILIISFVSFLLLVIMTFFIVRTSYINLKKSNALKELEKQRMEEQLEKDRKISELEKLRFDAELEVKNKELVGYSLKIVTKNDLLDQISRQANKYYDNQVLNKEYFNELSKIINDNLSLDKEWNEFKTLFEKVHQGFFDLLKQKCPGLTEHELRFCAYIKISLRPKEIARVLNISADSVKTFKSRLKKKIGIDSEVSIDDYIRNI